MTRQVSRKGENLDMRSCAQTFALLREDGVDEKTKE